MRRRVHSMSSRYCCSSMARSVVRLRRRWPKVCAVERKRILRCRSLASQLLKPGGKRSRWEPFSSRLLTKRRRNIVSSPCPAIEVLYVGELRKRRWTCFDEDYSNPQITQMILIIVVIVFYSLGSVPLGSLIWGAEVWRGSR